MTAYLQLLAVAALGCTLYGVYQLSAPWAWITGGAMLFLYAEVSLRSYALASRLSPPDGVEEDGP